MRRSVRPRRPGAEYGRAATSSRGCTGYAFERAETQPAVPTTRTLILKVPRMCNLHSITTNQAAIIALFRVVNQYVGNLGADARGSSRTIPLLWYATTTG